MAPKWKKQRVNKPVKIKEEEEEKEEDSISDDSYFEEIHKPNQPKYNSFQSQSNSQQAQSPNSNINSIPWKEKYKPESTKDICINKKKLNEVREALSKMIRNESNVKLLVLSGPSGSSKTTTVKLLTNELLPNNDIFGSSLIEYNESENFNNFLNECKYKQNSVILIDELPNIYHIETLINFRNGLKNWIYSDIKLPPIILIVSEFEYDNLDNLNNTSFGVENNLSVETLLTKEITSLSSVKTIKFNSIANKFLNTTISKIIKCEQLNRKVDVELMNRFLFELFQVGDIRSIINNFENWIKFDKKDNIENCQFLRENSLNLFHAIGKIIYSTKTGENGLDKDVLSIDQVLNNYPEKNSNLLSLSLLENYNIYQDGKYDINIAADIVDNLSINDVLGGNGELGIISTRINLSKIEKIKNQPQFMKMKYPRHFKMLKMYNKTWNQIQNYKKYLIEPKLGFINFQTLNLIDGYYIPMIYNKKKRSRVNYNRLGGKFSYIGADDQLTVDEDINIPYEVDQFQVEIDARIQGKEEKNDIEDYLSDPISDSDEGFSSDDELNYLMTQGIIP
ncbi:unnamed protein product [Candida verbasci]|uniref:Checkpoint protein RAD24-like helical bundle domain-containing protein n=1 Tax=Candida verbasci TaxID=1227364 RepID=A0A9W4XE94_9ASCO|nr:unnamed protein product [Candida verbasci]